MGIRFRDLERICSGSILHLDSDQQITHLIIDSRKIVSSPGSIFFAIDGAHHDGHNYLNAAFERGIRQFIISKPEALPGEVKKESNVLLVTDVAQALQVIVSDHRQHHDIPVIGITGSNGKTIVKEWLSELLKTDHNVVKSPKSYNSQVGVPLSVWQMTNEHQIGIFEAGISKTGEMINLQKIIRPTIGIFTNIGPAHDIGFESMDIKADEKLILFSECDKLIYCADHKDVAIAIERFKLHNPTVECISWSFAERSKTYNYSSKNNSISYGQTVFDLKYSDLTSLENIAHCITCCLEMGMSAELIHRGVSSLEPVNMRLELKRGINQCYLIDDSYNNDLAGLEIALDFMSLHSGSRKKALILSDILQSNRRPEELYKSVNKLLLDKGVNQLIGIGDEIGESKNIFELESAFYPSTQDFINTLDSHHFDNEIILVKGARQFSFEQIVNHLQEKIHGTRLEINLDALTENLNYYRSIIEPDVRLMVMVKAFAYGGGSYEIANVLQYHHVDYLAVAYVDEGVALRKKGITIPIMVMNVSPESFIHLDTYNLEPEIYFVNQLNDLIQFSKGSDLSKIHLKIDTGMHRLGFLEEDIDDLIDLLKEVSDLEVASIFTHLAASEDDNMDDFTDLQLDRYSSIYDRIASSINNQPLRHVLNSSGITRFPNHHMDMVRLGIGLHGIDPNPSVQQHLEPVSTLRTSISQIKRLETGESVGYGRAFIADKPTTIAVLSIGYADGYDRRFGNGKGFVIINGEKAAVVGNVCMDMTMVDMTGINVVEGAEVIVFGPELPVNDLANLIQTIPYEILTNVGPRVKRVFRMS